MRIQEYLDALATELGRLPEEEKRKSLAYYREMIEDRMEDGMDEVSAVAAMESPHTVAERILYEMPLSVLARSSVPKSGHMPVWAIIALIVGAPVWLPVLCALISVAAALYAAFWAVIITMFAGCAAVTLTGVLLAPYGVFALFASGAGGLAALGTGLLLAGLGMLLMRPMWRLAVLCARGTTHALKRLIIRKKVTI